MSIRWISGVLGDGVAIPDGEIVTLVDESFEAGFGTMVTPGSDEPAEAWSRGNGATPTTSTGPDGGSDPNNRSVNPALFYAFTEGTPAGGGIGPQRTYTMETREFDAGLVGLSTLTFDLHMRFGSQGGIADGTLFIEGWNGSAWSQISNSITGSQQSSADVAYQPSTNFGIYTSSGFANSDFKFRFRMVTGAQSNNYDTAVDNIRVDGPGADLPDPPDPNPVDARALAFNTGLRRLHVSQSSTPPVDGSTPNQTFTNLQTALNALQAGDVLTIGAGNYFGRFNRSNLQGSVNNPVWIAEEVLGTVQILDVEVAAFNGNQNWAGPFGAGNDRYTANLGDTYMCAHDGDFLPKYSSVGVLDAATASGQNKPVQGCAVSGNTLHIRLKNAQDPNGQQVIVTASTGNNVVSFSNCANVIWDGCTIQGGGAQSGIVFDTSCTNPTIVNMSTGTSRFLCRVGNDAIVAFCDYSMIGCAAWMRECVALNPGERQRSFFDIVKGDLAIGSNAVYEGGLAVGAGGFNSGTLHRRGSFFKNRMFGVFDGMVLGDFIDSEAFENVFDEIGDDCVSFEDGRNQNEGDRCRFFFNRMRNIYGPAFSHQNEKPSINFVIRNVVEITEPAIFDPEFLIKTNGTDQGAIVRIAHNLLKMVATSGTRNIWTPFGQTGAGTSGGQNITDFINNLVIIPSVSSNSGGVPSNIAANAVVGDASADIFIGTGGVDAGAVEADLDLNSDFTLQASSPARGIGVALPGGFVDPIQSAGANDDAGPFPFGFDPGPDWPRPFTPTFSTDLPPRWTSPGA